jgi:SAM-dependent methyltransferase
MGAGTGRVTKIVASTAARVLAFDRSPHMLDRARELLAGEVTRNVTLAAAENDAVPLPDGCADIVIEGWSFGHTVTGSRAPTPPGTVLPRFYAWLENDRGFTARWIRTDYVFESLDKARELVEFFFGSMVEHEIRPDGSVLVPECTGLW